MEEGGDNDDEGEVVLDPVKRNFFRLETSPSHAACHTGLFSSTFFEALGEVGLIALGDRTGDSMLRREAEDPESADDEEQEEEEEAEEVRRDRVCGLPSIKRSRE